nr:MAG TPA: hypothetical protein [Caudoviricetes sp.]
MARRMTVAEQYEWAKANAPRLDEMNTDYLDTSIYGKKNDSSRAV